MSQIVRYEAELSWGKLFKSSPDVFQMLIEDIKSFRPSVPIVDTSCVFDFSVNDNNTSLIVAVEIDAKEIIGDNDCEEDLLYSILDNDFMCRLKDLLFTINLAYPGCVHIFRSVVFRNRQPLSEQFSHSVDMSAWTHKDYAKWLPFESLTIQQCWDWIANKTNFLLDISRTPIDRALHALSYESSANEDMYIFYVLLGLEAIYNDANNREDSIIQQMCRKMQALLGELPPNAIKAIKEMYRRRSNLVHGGANIFKYWQIENCDEKEYNKIMGERQYIVLATGLLLATIQKFIKANANTLTETITVKLE